MIFVTVGEQLPFDRLIKVVDECALSLDGDIFAQIGQSTLQPQHILYEKFLDPLQFNKMFEDADIVIGHAGMGTIITALELGTPVIIMPRKASLGEHRNDHQLATAKRFETFNLVSVVFDETELKRVLLALQKGKIASGKIERCEPDHALIDVIRRFISS